MTEETELSVKENVEQVRTYIISLHSLIAIESHHYLAVF